MDRRPDEQTIRERAEFLAHEIHHDRLAPEAEVADAIELEIKRFARREELAKEITRRGGYFAVVGVERGPIKRFRNGTTAHEWAILRLSCGHRLTYERMKNPQGRPPAFALCREVHP